MPTDTEILTSLPESFLREFADEVLGTIPQEKVQADLRQAEIGRVLLKEGSTTVKGLGQKLGEIDRRTYFRWAMEHPGCWQDQGFINEFFADNPQLRSPGWKPKASSLRHGVTFVGGESVANLKTA